MNFSFAHFNFNVLDLEKSLKFYKEALGLEPVRRKDAQDGSFTLVYLGDKKTGFELELTYLRDRKEPYNLGELEYHLAMATQDSCHLISIHLNKWSNHLYLCHIYLYNLFGTISIQYPSGSFIK